MKIFIAVLLLLSCWTPMAQASDSAAAGSTKIPRVIPYGEDAANEAIRRECNFPTYLPEQIAKVAAKHDVAVQLSDEDLEHSDGRVLLIKTVYARASGGGSYTGKKQARIRGELRENGQVLGDFDIQRVTGRSWTACGSLQILAEALSGNVVNWLKSPQMGTRLGLDR